MVQHREEVQSELPGKRSFPGGPDATYRLGTYLSTSKQDYRSNNVLAHPHLSLRDIAAGFEAHHRALPRYPNGHRRFKG